MMISYKTRCKNILLLIRLVWRTHILILRMIFPVTKYVFNFNLEKYTVVIELVDIILLIIDSKAESFSLGEQFVK